MPLIDHALMLLTDHARQFAACGVVAYRAAEVRGFERQLPAGWFVQNIKI